MKKLSVARRGGARPEEIEVSLGGKCDELFQMVFNGRKLRQLFRTVPRKHYPAGNSRQPFAFVNRRREGSSSADASKRMGCRFCTIFAEAARWSR
jgi:hypothetical protein